MIKKLIYNFTKKEDKKRCIILGTDIPKDRLKNIKELLNNHDIDYALEKDIIFKDEMKKLKKELKNYIKVKYLSVNSETIIYSDLMEFLSHDEYGNLHNHFHIAHIADDMINYDEQGKEKVYNIEQLLEDELEINQRIKNHK